MNCIQTETVFNSRFIAKFDNFESTTHPHNKTTKKPHFIVVDVNM